MTEVRLQPNDAQGLRNLAEAYSDPNSTSFIGSNFIELLNRVAGYLEQGQPAPLVEVTPHMLAELDNLEIRPGAMIIVQKPLVIMYRAGDDSIVTNIHPTPDLTYEGYGLLICDLVRHVASAFKVDEDDVWEWVDKERRHHTTDIRQPS